MTIMPRIESIFGVSLPDVDEAAVDRLIDGKIREDTDLDFKQVLYGTNDAAKRELSGDVAALANTVGGVLVLGVRDEDAVAVDLTPVPLSDEEEVRMQQIVASGVAPHPGITIYRVPTSSDPSEGYYLIEVGRSPQAPHAVRAGTGLRYPKRSGASIRWLIESEVADAYRNRFFAAREQVQRLSQVRQEGEEALPTLTEWAWLSVAMVPNSPGEMPLTQRRVRDLRDFPHGPMIRLVGSRLRESAYQAAAGYRRVVLTASPDDEGKPRNALLHLHEDGSGYAAVVVGRQMSPHDGDSAPDRPIPVHDELLTQEVLSAVSILTKHAVENCGATGDAAVEATVLSPVPMYLAHSRQWTQDGWGPTVSAAAVGRRTLTLSEVANSPTGALLGARMVLTDLVQGFGVAESPQLDADGAVRVRYFTNGQQLVPVAERSGFTVTEAVLE